MDLHKILGDIRRADHDYNLIDDGDIIGVGVSGGKDSMILLTALHQYSKFQGKNFKVIGIHIKLGFPNMDFSEVQAYCEQEGIILKQFDSKVYEILKRNPDKEGRIKCSLCSKFKKACVNQAAKEFNCNKIAFGHHSDDAVETLFMNMIYGGKIATFLPKMHLSKDDVTFIRPLIYSYENDISVAMKKNNIPFVKSGCPNDGYTKRQEIKELLHDMYQTYPMAKNNFLKMIYNQNQIELWHPIDQEVKIKEHKITKEILYQEENASLIKKKKHYFIEYRPIQYPLQLRNFIIDEVTKDKIINKEITLQSLIEENENSHQIK